MEFPSKRVTHASLRISKAMWFFRILRDTNISKRKENKENKKKRNFKLRKILISDQ